MFLRTIQDKQLRSVSLIQFLFGLAEAAMSVRSTYLVSLGVGADKVAIMFAACFLLGAIAPFFWGLIADKVLNRYKAYLLTAVGLGLVFGFIPLSTTVQVAGLLLALFVMPVVNFFYGGLSTIADTVSINGCIMDGKTDFSLVRIWQSIGYIITCVLATPLMDHVSMSAPFYLCSFFCFSMLALLGAVKRNDKVDWNKVSAVQTEQTEKQPTLKKKGTIKDVFGNYYIMSFVVLSTIYAVVYACDSYIPYLLQYRQIDTNQSGVVYGLKVVGEVVAMLLLPKLKKKYSLTGLQVLVGLFHCGFLIAAQYVTTVPGMVAAELLAGFANGIAYSTAGFYLREMAPEGLEATALSMWTMGYSAGSMVLVWVLGNILETSSIIVTLQTGLGLMIAWTILFVLTLVFGSKVLKKKPLCPILFVKGTSEKSAKI